MTDPITDAVRAGCGITMGDGCHCPYPECECDDYGDMRIALERAARFARNAALEEAALDVDCGCLQRDAVLAAKPLSVQRDLACGHGSLCGAVQAESIRALKIGDKA